MLAIWQECLHYGHVDLIQPLSTLVPSLDADVLTVLVRAEAPLTGRGVAGLVRRGSRQGVQTVLDRLVLQGVVRAQPAGAATLFQLNRQHLLAEALGSIIAAAGTLNDRIRDDLAAWDTPPAAAFLFGSYARGTATPASDIDLFLVRPAAISEDEPDWRRAIDDLEAQVRAWTGNALEVLEVDEGELPEMIAREDRLLVDLRTDAIRLAGPSVRSLLTRRSANA